MNIRYKKTALTDIQEIERYISDTLHNKSAAKKLTTRIVQAILLLEDNPWMGTPLNSQYDVATDLRYLVVSGRLIFYRVLDDDYVEVIRVLDGRQDYMAILF